MWGIVAKYKNEKKFMALDYSGGCLVKNLIYATLWNRELKDYVQGLVDKLNSDNPSLEFKLKKRG